MQWGFNMSDVIRNVEWIHAYTKVTLFEFLHPVTHEWKKAAARFFLEDDELEKLYFEKIVIREKRNFEQGQK